MSKYVFFWAGNFSQWARSPFMIDGVEFITAEQYMMYKKAKHFGDDVTAQKVLETTNPRTQKQLGREVKNYDDAEWLRVAYDYVVEGNRAKFEQNPDLKVELQATVGKVLVEASPVDARWGIGMAADDPDIEDETKWRGQNLLGKALNQVRTEMFGT